MSKTPTTRWNLYLPTQLCDAIDKTLTSPFSGNIPPGARADLICRLLTRYLEGSSLVQPGQEQTIPSSATSSTIAAE